MVCVHGCMYIVIVLTCIISIPHYLYILYVYEIKSIIIIIRIRISLFQSQQTIEHYMIMKKGIVI